MAKLGPYSRSLKTSTPDGRTREGRMWRAFCEELIAHVGGRPTPVQPALIEQASMLRLRLALMDRKFSRASPWTEHDNRTYLAWSGSYTRLLREIGVKGASDKQKRLSEHLASSGARV